jgi:hypothetical protein
MPDREPTAGQSAGLLRGLIWGGVSLAPVAAAVVLIGGSQGSTRFAVLLLAVSVVLVGASVLIRNDPALQRMDVEDRVTEEVRKLRRELRAEFGRPGKSGHPPQSARPDQSTFFRDEPMLPPEPGAYAPDNEPVNGFAGGGYPGADYPGGDYQEDGFATDRTDFRQRRRWRARLGVGRIGRGTTGSPSGRRRMGRTTRRRPARHDHGRPARRSPRTRPRHR